MNNECFPKKYLRNQIGAEEDLEAIRAKNPFLYIIKISENKKKKSKDQTQQSKQPFIHKIEIPKNPNEKKSTNNTSNTQAINKAVIPNLIRQAPNTNEALQKEIERLHSVISDKDKQLALTKEHINTLLIENLTLKSQVTQYKDKFDLMVNDGNIISKETIFGIYDEANVPHTEIPNLDEMTYEDLLSLEEKIGYVNKGFTKEQITKIPLKKYHKDHNTIADKCVICQFDIEEGNNIKMLSCEHFYHEKCIDLWLQKEKSCPFCKNEVSIA